MTESHSQSSILLYQADDGRLQLDVFFEEDELEKEVVVRKFRITTPHGAIPNKTQEKEVLTYAGSVSVKTAHQKADQEF